MFTKRLKEIEARKLEIRGQLVAGGEADLDALEKELKDLETEEEGLKRRQAIIDGINTGAIPASSVPNPHTPENRQAEDDKALYRSAFMKNLMGQQLTEAEQRAFNASGAAGAMPEQTVNQILEKLKQIVPMLGEINLFHFPGAVKFAVEGTRNDASLHTENASISDSADTLVTITLGAYEIVKILKVSETVKVMTVSGFETWLVDNLTASVAEKIDAYICGGSGSSEPQGIAYAASWVANTNARAWAGGSLANVDITAAIALLPGRYDRGAKFYMSKKTFWNNVMPIRDDAKAPIVKEAGGKYYIHGYEVGMDDNFGDGVIYFGNAKKIYGNLGENINVKADEHAGFTSASVVYRGMAIFDCKLAVDDAFVKIASSIA